MRWRWWSSGRLCSRAQHWAVGCGCGGPWCRRLGPRGCRTRDGGCRAGGRGPGSWHGADRREPIDGRSAPPRWLGIQIEVVELEFVERSGLCRRDLGRGRGLRGERRLTRRRRLHYGFQRTLGFCCEVKIAVHERREVVFCGVSRALSRDGALRATGVGTRARGIAAQAAFCAQHLTLVGTVLNLAADPAPVLLEGVVALDQGLQFEAARRVSDLDLAQRPEAPVHVLARDLRLDLLDAQKILLIQRTQPVEAVLEFVDLDVELVSVQCDVPSQPLVVARLRARCSP